MIDLKIKKDEGVKKYEDLSEDRKTKEGDEPVVHKYGKSVNARV